MTTQTLVERLRHPVRFATETQEQAKLRHFKERHEAADRIEALEASNAQLVAVLESIDGRMRKSFGLPISAEEIYGSYYQCMVSNVLAAARKE